MAQTVEGDWIVVECNDAQEPGYGGVERLVLWQQIVELEQRVTTRQDELGTSEQAVNSRQLTRRPRTSP